MENVKNFEWLKENIKSKNIAYLGIRALDEGEK